MRKRLRISFVLAATLLLTAAAVGPTLAAPSAAPLDDMVITGVIDGPITGGLPKAVEFYVVNNIADLSTYGFGSANNGGGTDGEEFTFPADSASAGDFIYVATEATEFTNFFGFAPDYTHGSAANINGDDAIELFESGVVVDVFGDINVDGTSQPWEYMDGWAYRVNGTGPDGSTFVLGNWTFSGPNALDGETDNGSAAIPFPAGTYVPAGVDAAPFVASTSPSNGATGVAVDTDITLNFSEDVTTSGTWFDINCTSSGAHTAAESGGPQSFTLNPDVDFSMSENCTVTIFAAQVTDTDTDDPPDNMATDFAWSFDTVEPSGPSDLLLTGVIDGPLSGGLPKGVEFYVVNNIADLSTYGFGSANNGGGTDGQEFTFPAVPATAGDFIYVASEATGFPAFFGFAADYTSSAANINGDDAIELFESGVVVDVFGDINVDGTSQPWEYMDGWAYRVNGTGPDGSTFVLGNWTFSGPNALDGETTNATAATPFPIGTYVPSGVDLPPSVASTSPASGDDGVALDTNITLNFSEDVTVTGSWFDITCTASGAHTAVFSGGPQSYTLDPDVDFSSAESCTLTVFAAQVADQDGTPDNMTADFVASFDLAVEFGVCGDSATFIHSVQGNGFASPIVDANVVIEGVVVGDYQDPTTELGGFFIQEEDLDADADPATSEGVFVYDGGFGLDVNPGDVVRVQGDVTEFSDLTEVTNVSNAVLCSTGAAVTPATVTLPLPAVTDLEMQEGMLVTFPQELAATESYYLGRFGQVSLSLGGRLFNPTHLTTPGAAANAQQDVNDRSRVLLDDHNSQQNIDPTFHPPGGLSATNTLRLGSTISNLTGVMSYSFGDYVIEPIGPVAFADANPRTPAPDPVGGSLRVASFNVLNYFTTLDDGVNDICGPAGDQECRGADSATEFTRQRDKIVSAIVALGADVVGLMEIENHPGDDPVADLVAGLNDATAPGTYDYVATGAIGTDAIRVAFIYKPASVTPYGAHAILDSSVDPLFDDNLNRPALAQTFEQNSNGARLTVVVNHLKSKGSPCDAVGDPDVGDGQGNCNVTRTNAATALANWLATDPTGSGDADFLIIGDLNSYAMEDPITAIKNAGYTNLIEVFGGASAYSYVFDGQFGYLDHGLSNASLTPQVTGVTEWHINSDEPIVLDYNVEFKSANHVVTLYDPFAYRASDHDPVVVGLDLTPPLCNGLVPTIVGTDGPDFLHGTYGDDVILARGGDDFVYAKGGNDTICTGDGDDRVFASFGNDYVDGGNGEDSLYGQSGNDELQGGNDNDRLFGSLGNDVLGGGDGDDLLSGSLGDDDLQGGSGNDLLFGSKGTDLLAGGPGDDYLLGSQGNDFLDGGDDTDFLLGGPNVDTCFYGETNLSCEVIGP